MLFQRTALFGQTFISAPTWSQVSGPWADACSKTFGAIASSQQNRQLIYLGSSDVDQGCGLFRSMDGGQSWVAVNNGIGQIGLFSQHYPPVSSISVAPSDQYTVYAATYSPFGAYIYRSTDGGRTWEEASGPKSFLGVRQVQNAISLAVDPSNSGTVYAGLASGGVVKTTDGGRNWTTIQAAGNDDFYTIVRSPHVNTVIIAGATRIDSACLAGPSQAPRLSAVGSPSIAWESFHWGRRSAGTGAIPGMFWQPMTRPAVELSPQA
jgi:photosystem II stability/assembly factor-like uncharacterized protein